MWMENLCVAVVRSAKHLMTVVTCCWSNFGFRCSVLDNVTPCTVPTSCAIIRTYEPTTLEMVRAHAPHRDPRSSSSTCSGNMRRYSRRPKMLPSWFEESQGNSQIISACSVSCFVSTTRPQGIRGGYRKRQSAFVRWIYSTKSIHLSHQGRPGA